MASRPNENGDFIVQQDEESNDENMEDVINIDNIEIEKGAKSKKECMILKILEEKDDKYLVLWNNQTKSWLNKEDISQYAIINQREINSHNRAVQHNIQEGSSSIASKKAFIYGRISQPQKKTKYTHSMNITNSSEASSNITSMTTNPTSHTNSTGYNFNSYNFSDSIETQKEICYKYCLKNNILVDYAGYDEGVSGRFMKNINYELGAWCPYLMSGIHMIIVLTPDRLGRHAARVQSFLNSMIDRNIDVYFVKEDILWNKHITSEKKRVIQQILIDAEYISNQTSERIKNTIKRKKAKGHKMGKPPFGFKAYHNNQGIRKFKMCPKEDLIIKDILKMDKIYSIDSKKYTKKYRCEMIQKHVFKVYKRNLSLNMIKNIIKKHNNIEIQSKNILTKNINFINKSMFSLIINPENKYKRKGKEPASTQAFEMIDNEEIDLDNMAIDKSKPKPKHHLHKSSDKGFLDKIYSYFSY